MRGDVARISEHFGGWFWPAPYSYALLQAAQHRVAIHRKGKKYALSKSSQIKSFLLNMVKFGKQHLEAEEPLCTEKKTAGC